MPRSSVLHARCRAVAVGWANTLTNTHPFLQATAHFEISRRHYQASHTSCPGSTLPHLGCNVITTHLMPRYTMRSIAPTN